MQALKTLHNLIVTPKNQEVVFSNFELVIESLVFITQATCDSASGSVAQENNLRNQTIEILTYLIKQNFKKN